MKVRVWLVAAEIPVEHDVDWLVFVAPGETLPQFPGVGHDRTLYIMRDAVSMVEVDSPEPRA